MNTLQQTQRWRGRHNSALALVALAGAALPSRCTAQQPSVPSTQPAHLPLVTSWFTQNSSRYARVVQQNGAAPTTVWPAEDVPNRGGGQYLPVYADIQQVSYSADWVYVKGTGLASHQMGPWYVGIDRIFGNWPSNQSYLRRIPRTPHPAQTKYANGMGDVGVWVNGVAMFNMLDGAHYDSRYGQEIMGPPMQSARSSVWVRDAVPVEGITFDRSNAHQPPMGTYHYHSNPLALRMQLNDNVRFDSASGRYVEVGGTPHHSPILGWAYDGFPVYGPYGYSNPMDPTSGVRRMVTGYVLRNGENGTADLRVTGRRSLGAWARDLHGTGDMLTEEQSGPHVSVRYPLGRYCEDYDYLGDLGRKQGDSFDLDRYNGRFCITPEFPHGAYAYFVAIRSDGVSAFPYVLGRQYYGEPTGGNVASISEPVTVAVSGGKDTPIDAKRVTNADGSETVRWNSVEGGHYEIDARTAANQWMTIAADVRGTGSIERYTLPTTMLKAGHGSGIRVVLSSLDTYDNTPPQMRGPGRPGPGGPGGPGFGGPGPDGQGGPPAHAAISAVSPAAASAGQTTIVTLTLSGARFPPEFVQPRSVSLGAIKASRIQWDGQTLTAEFSLPADAAQGAYDMAAVFPGPPGAGFDVTFRGKALFTIR